MRTKLFFWTLLLFTITTFAQYTSIPDSNFEDALQSLGLDSGTNDGRVLTANISSITSLDLNSKSISDLTGIEAFVSLETLFFATNNISTVDLSSNASLKRLSCGGNNLSSLNLTNNVDLEIFSCINNQITTIDFSTNTKLETIAVSQNLLTELDVSNNLALKILWVDFNEITSLDVSKNIALEELAAHTNQFVHVDMRNGANTNLQSLSLSGNPNLSCVLVDDAAFSNTNWAVFTGVIDTSVTRFVASETDCEESYTYVPDDNFEQALIDLGYDSVLNDYVVTAKIRDVTILFINNKGINDLTGIADFEALTNLSCFGNTINNLDVSSNVNLSSLTCFNNSMESLILSDNTNLISISCFDNNLEAIDVSGCSNLKSLYCHTNNLEVLDVSKNTKLENFHCYKNSLSTLDISSVNIAKMISNFDIFSAFQAYDNENLSCIVVGETFIEDSRNAWSNDIDDSSRFVISLEACENATYVPDNNFEQALIDLNLDDYLDDYVVTANINGITSLDVQAKEISDLTGIEDFTVLEILEVQINNLTMLDVLALTSLKVLNCSSNSIENLDLSNNNRLEGVFCGNNDLTFLNAANGNNAFIDGFVTTNNPNLSCIQIDDVNAIGLSWDKDETASYNEDCIGTASVVDTVFSNKVSVFPNPVSSILHIDVANGETIEEVELFNMEGKKLIKQSANTIDFSGIPQGIYILKIKTLQGKIAMKKVIKN